MRVILIENGIVTNVVEVESIEKARAIFPHALVMEHHQAGPGWRWDGKGTTAPDPLPDRLWDELPIVEYLALFTPAEFMGFASARTTDAALGHLMYILDRAQVVHRAHPLVQAGLDRAVELKILTPERRKEIGG